MIAIAVRENHNSKDPGFPIDTSKRISAHDATKFTTYHRRRFLSY